jgi:hypothetical protein
MNGKFESQRKFSLVDVSKDWGAVMTHRKTSAVLIGVFAGGMLIGFLMSTYEQPRPIEPWDHPELACR